ncbi:hypothetical protein NDU88_000944 [Pleurodeles waltl]|uniref:Uncharacterized protein n=1 Tax=Pleurodeles waltl TaxID=8319 RepID=A0AAV7MJJ7_PLEWA|nr:hypothetical protein NDU88_000944 [Pleurodeles waltl]
MEEIRTRPTTPLAIIPLSKPTPEQCVIHLRQKLEINNTQVSIGGKLSSQGTAERPFGLGGWCFQQSAPLVQQSANRPRLISLRRRTQDSKKAHTCGPGTQGLKRPQTGGGLWKGSVEPLRSRSQLQIGEVQEGRSAVPARGAFSCSCKRGVQLFLQEGRSAVPARGVFSCSCKRGVQLFLQEGFSAVPARGAFSCSCKRGVQLFPCRRSLWGTK